MDKYKALYNALKTFYKVNPDLLSDLENYSIEETGRSLDANIELYAAKIAESNDYMTIKKEIDYLNEEPHSISEMEIMYELIDNFAYID